MPGKSSGFVPNKGDKHGEEHERHGVVIVVDCEGDGGKKKSDGEKKETMSGGLLEKNKEKNKKGGNERKSDNKVETKKMGIFVEGGNANGECASKVFIDATF